VVADAAEIERFARPAREMHWPASFEAEHGGDAQAVVGWAARNATDDNRYLKLRRIALENLALVL
jgi:hypothetical protein